MDEEELVHVTEVRYSGGTMAEVTGFVIEADMEVEFAGDWRPMRDLNEAVSRAHDAGASLEDYPVVGVPSWAITSRRPARLFL